MLFSDCRLPKILLRSTSLALFLLGCAANVESGGVGGGPLPALAAQRVTATVKREALRLVRLETEREVFLTTPEHPFATPRSGWISAGRLGPGEWVVSERFGAVRIRSVQNQATARAVAVFNLSVTPSHAYFVGTERVLVHNTCASESAEAKLERLIRERDALGREAEALKAQTPSSPRIDELKRQRRKLNIAISNTRQLVRKKQGVAAPSGPQRELQKLESKHEAELEALEEARHQLAELESRPASSEAEKAVLAAQKAELARQIKLVKASAERTNRILTMQRDLMALEKATPALDEEGRIRQEKLEELRDELRRERKRAREVKHMRGKRAALEAREERSRYERNLERHLSVHRPAKGGAKPKRPRQPSLELLNEELANELKNPPSERRDTRVQFLREWIATIKNLLEVDREQHRLRQSESRARLARENLLATGRDTSEVDKKLEHLAQKRQALRVQGAQLRISRRLLFGLAGTPWADAPGALDEAALRDLERQLAEGLTSHEQLADIEHALDSDDFTHSDWLDVLLNETADVDGLLSEREQLMRQSPSPARTTELQSSYERLQQELREERAAVEAALAALANEYAQIHTTEASSSSGPTWQARLRAIQEEQVQLRAHRRAGLQKRLDHASQELHLLQSIERFRDENIEAELARQIALLEHELQSCG